MLTSLIVPACGKDFAGVAQLVEHLICNQRVGGSNPFASSKLRRLAGVSEAGARWRNPERSEGPQRKRVVWAQGRVLQSLATAAASARHEEYKLHLVLTEEVGVGVLVCAR